MFLAKAIIMCKKIVKCAIDDTIFIKLWKWMSEMLVKEALEKLIFQKEDTASCPPLYFKA